MKKFRSNKLGKEGKRSERSLAVDYKGSSTGKLEAQTHHSYKRNLIGSTFQEDSNHINIFTEKYKVVRVHTVGAVGGVLRELHDGIGLQRIDDGRKGRSGRLLDRDVVLVHIRRNGGVDVARQEV